MRTSVDFPAPMFPASTTYVFTHSQTIVRLFVLQAREDVVRMQLYSSTPCASDSRNAGVVDYMCVGIYS